MITCILSTLKEVLRIFCFVFPHEFQQLLLYINNIQIIVLILIVIITANTEGLSIQYRKSQVKSSD